MTLRLYFALAALLAAAGACDNGRRTNGPGAPPASLSLKGRRFETTVSLTEKDRRKAALRLTALPEGRGHLLAWPRERFLKLETEDAQASFDAVFLDRAGRVVDHGGFAQGRAEGIQTAAEAAWAFLAAPGTLKRLDVKIGDRAEPPAGLLPQELPVVKIGGAAAYVELALTGAERAHGLMFRTRLSADDGMLFVYADEDLRHFWMKNTLLPLDIAFFRADGEMLNVNETPMYPDPRNPSPDPATSDSAGPAKFVLEMNLGWFRRKGLTGADGKVKPGTRAEFPPEALRGFGD